MRFMQAYDYYEVLMTYTLPFALRESDLEEDEILDYIHDFYIDLQDNEVQWVDGVRQGTYDLEKLNPKTMKPIITRFFFQYVTRAKQMEGKWVDRRLLGRRTQQEQIKGCDLTPHHIPPPMSYEMHLRSDCELFFKSLSEDEALVLNQLVRGGLVKDQVEATGKSYKVYRRVLNRLQTKAREQLM